MLYTVGQHIDFTKPQVEAVADVPKEKQLFIPGTKIMFQKLAETMTILIVAPSS
jgi:hypothetical protein